MNKLILTDCDGCLCDWEWAFRVWMLEHGYEYNEANKNSYYLTHHYDISESEVLTQVRMFNESAAIGFLPASRDATHYVKRLHEEHGFKFRVITSLSLDKNSQKLRHMNLRKIFGDAIESVVFLDTNAAKDQVLLEYKGSGMFWIEDKIENADIGHDLGLKSILIEHGYNMHHVCTYPIVKNWKEIYEIVTK